MNREILFRGKRVDNGEWVEGFCRRNTFYDRLGDCPKEVYTKYFIGAFDNVNLIDRLYEQVEVIPETVGQYTEMSTKHKNIFEGDKLNGYHYQGIVKFIEGCWYLVGGNNKSALLYYVIEEDQDIEITGNIHDKK